MNKINEENSFLEYMPNKKDIKNISSFFYAFSDVTRLKIIILLMLKPLCVSEVSRVLNLNQTTVSHQLKILKYYNIVDGERTGKNIIYCIKNKNIEEVLNATVECF